jgi:hypothetical protein
MFLYRGRQPVQLDWLSSFFSQACLSSSAVL